MKPTTTKKFKLLIAGAFFAFTQFAYGQSITAEHYEASSGQSYLLPAPFFASNIRICPQDSVKLTATGFTGTTFTWTLPDNTISSITSTSIWIKEPGTYQVSDGSANATVYVNKVTTKPEIYSSEYPVTEIKKGLVGTDTNTQDPGNIFGFFSATDKEQWIAPVGKKYKYNKQQYMILASELTAMGFSEGSSLRSMGFYFNSSWSGCSSNGYNLRMNLYETTSSSMGATFQTSNPIYLGNKYCENHNSGWNYFDFDNHYEWDGTSNLVFDFSYYNENTSTSNPSIALDQTTFDATTISLSSSIDLRYNQPNASFIKSAGSYRPSISFKYSRPALEDTIVACSGSIQLDVRNGQWNNTYSWSSVNGLSSATSNVSVSGSDLVYLASEDNNLCLVKDTVQVFSSSVTTPIITASSTDFCEGETVTLSTTLPADHTLQWSTSSSSSSITVSDGGDYSVTVTNKFGCSSTSADMEITEVEKPVIFTSESSSQIYFNQQHTLTPDDGSVQSISNFNHLFDYDGKKYFVSRYQGDSANFVNVVNSNSLANLGVIQSEAMNEVFMAAHEEKYNLNSSVYPSYIYTGARWDGTASIPRWIDGSTSTYHDFYDQNPSNNDYYFWHYYSRDYWNWTSNYSSSSSYGGLIYYNKSDLELQNGSVVCDSVQLFAPSIFDSFTWSTGDTTESIWVSGTGSHSVYVTGSYEKSDGTSCSLTSDTYTFTINSSPALTITNESGTEDLDGSNTIELEATYTSGSTISWSTGATADSIFVTSAGEYTATVELNGCSTTKTVNIYEPIFVDDDGSDITGTGTLANPYETLAKGLTEVASGGKVYVLPGTYTETVNITKNVFIASDYYRLGDSAALHSTIIDGEGQRRLVNYDNTTETLDSSKSKIVGFTMTDGFEENNEGAGIYGGWNVYGTTQIQNCLIEEISRKCCASGIVLGWMSYNAHLILDSVFVTDIGQANYGDQRRAFYLYNGQLTLKNSVVENTKHDNGLFSLENSAVLNLENVRITDVHENYGDNGSVFYLNSSSKAYLNHVTIDNIYLDSRYIARILSNNVTFHVINSVIDNAEGRFLRDQSSGVAEVEIHNSVIGNGESGYTGSYLTSLPGVGQDGSLADNSEAIGYASANVLVGSKKYTSPIKDITGKLRPVPTGTSPDAGAYESDKAQGDFDVLLTQCGYLLEANVLNSSAYSVEWLLNGQVVSSDESWVTTSKGLYTANVYSTDRFDTITKTINLSNPLEFEIFTAKDICTEVSSNNGEITYGNVSGGTQFNHNEWWSYRGGLTGIDNTYQNSNYFQSNNSQEGSYNLSEGTYYVYVEDGLGCQVGDTITLVDQDYARYYVSTYGDDSNDGKSESAAFKTIEHALTKVCDLDQVVLLPGTYEEDSLIVDRKITLASKYLIDSDTSHISSTIIEGDDDFLIHWKAGNNNSWADTANSKILGLTLQGGLSNDNSFAAGITVDYKVLAIDHVVFNEMFGNQYRVIRAPNTKLSLTNSKIRNQKNLNKPSIYSSYGLFLDNVEFVGNQGSSYDAILLEHGYGDNSQIRNLKAHGNDANYGRLFRFSYSGIELSNVIIQNNIYGGSALYFNYGYENRPNYISNVLITDNVVRGSYSGIYFYNFRDDANVTNVTVSNNTFSSSNGYALYYSPYGSGTNKLRVLNSVFEKPDGSNYAVYISGSNGTVNIANSLIENTPSSIYSSSSITPVLTDVIFANAFLDENSSNPYEPSRISRALGGGLGSKAIAGTTLVAPSTDIYGNPRPGTLGQNPDMGAVESPLDSAVRGVLVQKEDNGFCETSSGEIVVSTVNYGGVKTYTWAKAGDATWTWSTTDSIASGLEDGTYSISVADSLNSTIGDTTITISTRPIISITDLSEDALCFGNGDAELSFELAGGNPFGGSQYQYNIQYLDNPPLGVQVDSMGSTYYFQESISSSYRAALYTNSNNVYQGDYYVTITDFDGCTVDDTITIGNQYALPVVSVYTESNDGTMGLTSACTGSSIDLTVSATSASATSFTYEWSTLATSNEINVVESGEYYVKVTDNLTCVNRDTVSIYFQEEPLIVLENGIPPVYYGNNISGIYGTSSTYIGQYGENHYYYIDSYKTWPEAKQIAEDLGGRLPIIEDYSQNYWLAQNIRDNVSNHNDPWIGVYYDGSDWVDVDGNALNFTYWSGSAGNSPNNSPYETYPYAYMAYWGEWYNYYEYNTRPIVVEFAPSDLPITNNMSFCDSVEFKALKFADFVTNTSITDPRDQGFKQVYWKDANGTILDSGEYVTLSSNGPVQLEGVFLRSDGSECILSSAIIEVNIVSSPSLTFTTYDSLNNQYFIGSNILACAETELYTTVSANSDTSNSFTYSWSSGESDSIISTDMWTAGTVEVTDVLGCSTTDSLTIFKKSEPIISKSVISTDTSMTYYGAPYIPNFYYQGQIGNNYIYASSYSATWSQARQDALALGGDLASFSTESEYNTLTSWSWNDRFVGLNDSVTEGVWQFSDGTPVTYLPPSWGQGEPNNSGNEDYITISNYNFNDIGENSQYEFFLQIPVPPTEVPLLSGEAFCDSVTLIASETATEDSTTLFSKVYWKNAANGAVIDSTETLKITSSINLYLEGYFDQSNGTECAIIGDTLNIIINETPDLLVYSADSTFELTTDTMSLIALSNAIGASITWQVDTSIIASDTLAVYERGLYTATASLNGCSVSEEVFVDRPLFVAKTGSNITGTGSLDNPFKTIQFAIDTARSGQKIYVLPGTYSENLVLDKQLRIFSDYERLGDASAISATQISGSNTGPVFTFQGEHYDDNGNWKQGPKWSKDSTIISGFTIRNGYGNGNTGGGFQSQSNYYATSGILVKNAVVRNNTNVCCNDGIVAKMDMPLHFDNVTVRNNGSPTNYDERTLFAFYHSKETVWKNVKFYSNEAQNHLIRLTDNQTFIVENSLFYDNIITDNEQALFGLDGNVTLVLNHTTIENSTGQGYAIKFDNSWGNQEVILFNSIIGPHTKGSIHTSSSIQKVYAHNSVISSANGAFHGSGSLIKTGNTLTAPTMGIGTNHKLTANSPAIGLGGSDTTIVGIVLQVPELDLAGFSRPLPAGSNPDAGAYEDSLQRGNFNMYLDQCGLLVWATTVNGGSYQLTWMNGLDTLSNSDSAFVPSVGSYTVVGYSEYGDTLTKSISVSNPLSIDLLSVKDACVDISQYSGTIKFDSPDGGSPYGSSYWYEYVTNLTGANDTNGYSNSQEWNDYQQPEFTGLAPGEYIFELSDANGCSVYDTVTIGSKYGQTVYVDVNGDDLNDGSELSPLETINEALSRLCDGDTIIIESGTYYENIVMPNELASVTIMSRFGLNQSDSSIIDQTIINGDADGRVFDIYTNYNTSYSTDTVSIIGLTIKNGYVANSGYGGGIAVQYRTLDLRSSKIIGNEAYYGGGIYATAASLKLSDVDITNNTASYRGGGIYTTSSIYNYILDDVVIENNNAQDGGGIYLYNYFWTSSNYEDEFSNFVIRNNTATSNGGGVYAYLSSSGRIVSWKNWLVTGNVASNEGGAVYMGGYNSSAELHIINSIFYGNEASNTPGVYVEGGDVNFIHSTIAGNVEKTSAWGTYKNTQLRANSNAEIQLWNTIVAGDRTEPYQIVLYDQNRLTSHMSLVDGGNSVVYLEQDTANSYQSGNTYTGLTSSNFVDGPFTFVDAGNGDFTPSGNTSAIGAGLTSFTGPLFPVYDFNGAIRPDSVGTQPDLGAIESDLSSPEFGVGFTVVNNTACATSIATIQALAQQGTAPYDYYFVSLNPTQNPISGTTSFTNKSANNPVTIANLFSGIYGCYAVDANGDSAYAEVEVQQADSVNIFIDKIPIFCAGDADGELTATVTGGNGQYAVNWIYPNQYSVSSYAINNLDTGVYTFTVTSDGCIYTITETVTEVNQLSPLVITSSINKAGTIVLDDADVRMCIGDEVTFDAGSGYISYLWETQDGFNSQNTQTINESESKNYFLTAIDTNGCYNYDTAKVYVVYEPNVYASNVNVVSSAQTPQVTSYLLGDEENSDNFSYYNYGVPKPYGSNYKKGRTQFIISASELQSAGLTENTTINSLGFEVESVGSIVQQFEIKMSHTTQQQLSYYENNLDLVYQVSAFSPTEGWVTHNLNTPWAWDGVNNIVVDVQYDNFNYGSMTRVKLNKVNSGITLTLSEYDNYGIYGSVNTSSWRPNVRFGIDKVEVADTIRVCDFSVLNTTDDYDQYQWYVDGVADTTTISKYLDQPADVFLLAVDAASQCYMYSDTFNVALDTTPVVDVVLSNSVICIGDTVFADAGTGFASYTWNDGSSEQVALLFTSGTYIVSAASSNGCPGYDTVNVVVNTPPDLIVELNGEVLTSTDSDAKAGNSGCNVVNLLPYTNNFEDSLLVWNQSNDDDLDWIANMGPTDTDFSGPSNDTIRNAGDSVGTYFFINRAGANSDDNKVAYLTSDCIDLLGAQSPFVEFYYHMYDGYASVLNIDQMGDLEIQVRDVSQGTNYWITMFSKSGNQGNNWHKGYIDLSSFVGTTVQLRVKGTAGIGGPRSEMAVDGFSVLDTTISGSNGVVNNGRTPYDRVCAGDKLYAKALIDGNDVSGAMSFLWSDGRTGDFITLDSTGWYNVVMTDTTNCELVSDSVFIEVSPAPNNMLVLSDTTQYCYGMFDSLMITAVPGYSSYEWNIVGEEVNVSIDTCSLELILIDSYGDGWNGATAQVKDANGTVITTIGSNFTSGSIYNDTLAISGGSAYTIEVSNVGSYVHEIGLYVVMNNDTLASYANTSSTTLGTVMASFTPNCGTQATGNQSQMAGSSMIVIDSISTGTTGYYVTITDSVGCRANSEVVNLIQRDNPTLQFVSNALLCNNDSTGSIDLTVVGNGGFEYGWNTGDITQNVEDLSAGWYSVTVVDSFSCSTIDSVEVIEPTPVVLIQVTTGDVLCFGGNDGYADYTFSGGVGGYTYAWTDSSGTWSSDSLSLANAPIGTYYLSAQDSNGCSLVDTVGIDQPSELILTLDSTINLSCYQSADGQAFASVIGGFGSYTYRLDGNVVMNLNDTTLNAGSHTYSVTDDNGCTDSVSFTLTEPQLLTASTVVSQYLGGIQISCNGANDGSIDVTVNGGTWPYTFSWNDGDTTEDRSLLTSGTYSMTVQDAQGCEVIVNEALLEPTQVQMTSMATDLNCYGSTDAEVGYTISGGTAPYATLWSGSAGTAIDSVFVTFQVDMQGAPINTGGIQVVSNSGLNLPMNIVPVLEDSVYRVTTQVSTGSVIQYRFFNGSSAETVPSACGLNVSGTFYREVEVLSDTTIAANAFSSCTVSTPALSGAMISGPRTITGLGAGIYTMNMSDVNGCTVIITDTIVNPDSLYISAVSIVDASCPQNMDGAIDITVTGGTGPYNFLWSNSSTSEDIMGDYGYYSVQITDQKGCIDSATYLIDAPFPYNDEEICVVTVDTTGVNMVVWEKTPGEKTAEYVMLRENASTQYVSVGSNQYNDMSTFVDQNSNPAVQPYRYRILVMDSCGNYSDTSAYHATIHLQASQGVALNEVQLQWTAYEGKQVQTYYIYRWLSPTTRVLVDSVSANVQTYTDIYPVNTTITALLYEVGAKFVDGGCSPTAGKQASYVTSMSNRLDWGTDGGLPIGTDEWVNVVLESDLGLFPNPTQGYLNVSMTGAWEQEENVQMKVLDITGRVIAQREIDHGGDVRFDFRELPAGVYFIHTMTERGRIIVKRFERIN